MRLSKYSEKDEVRYLKKKDLSKNSLIIRGRNGTKDRTISLGKDIVKMVLKVLEQEQIIEER